MSVSLNNTPLSAVVNAADQDRYTIEHAASADGSEAYIITDDATGARVRVQAGGDPDPLSLCGEDTDSDDWGVLSIDPATAAAEIADFTRRLTDREGA